LKNNCFSDKYWKMNENQRTPSISMIISKIRKNLTPDLLKGRWETSPDDGVSGHCYVATEALYWLVGKQLGFKPYVLSHSTCPELLDEGETHWFLMKDDMVLDATADQFKGRIPYVLGKPNGMMNHPEGGSQRAQVLIKKIRK
jgi:hypothetical protein